MSLYGALLTGVSGLDANSRALAITASNIANVNTVGYKANIAAFSTFLGSTGQVGDVSPSSVEVYSQQQLTRQGLLTSTNSSTDLAVNGKGFFVVTDDPTNPNAAPFYTRAGAFTPDGDGLLRNSAGYYLEGWRLNPDGSMPTNRSSLEPIDLGSLSGTAEATSTMWLRANLQSSATAVAYTAGDMYAGTVTPEFEQTVNVYDSQGGTRPMQLSFVKTAADTWAYEISYQGPVADIGGAGNNPVASGTLTFNADGTLASPSSVTMTIPWDASTGLASQDVTVNLGTIGTSDGIAQYDAPSALTAWKVNGAPYGALASVSVDELGYVSALFDNGFEKKVFKVALATFTNPDALAPISGNAYRLTDASGTATIAEPKTQGIGSISSNSLEASTVDLAKEFSDLITTQRAYSAATRIITTSDQMLQELMQIKQ